jgi:PAS domain S-box-containing protein
MSEHTNQFLAAILNGGTNPVFVKDSTLKFVFINDAFTRMTGLKEEHVLGKDDYDFFTTAQADAFKAIDEHVLNTGIKNFNEEKLLKPDGTILTLNTSKSRITDEFGNHFIVGNIYDTTERKQLIDKLKISNQMLKRYANLVSHDLKTPVSTIHRFSQLMSRSAISKLDTTETEYLHFITSSSRRLFELVERILDFSQVNMQEFKLDKVNINDIVNNVKSDLRTLIEDGDCSVEFKNLPEELIADKRLLYSVFQNLISNAIKFKANDRNSIVNISCAESEDTVIFTIADNGIGIEEKEQEKIFEMFERLDSNSVSGSGIGLALSKMIIQRHGGKIWTESEVGKGSQFKFTIPQDITMPF